MQNHLEIEEERLRTFSSLNVAFVTKGDRPKGNKNNRGKHFKRFSHYPKKGKAKGGVAKKLRLKAMEKRT